MAVTRKTWGSPKKFNETKLKDTIKVLQSYSEEEQASILAARNGIPYIDLNIYPVSIETLNTVTEEFSRAGDLVVIHKAGKRIKVAVINPESENTKQALRELQIKDGYQSQLYLASKTGLTRALAKYKLFNLGRTLEDMRVTLSGRDLEEFEEQIKELVDLQKRILELPTTEVLNIIVAGAMKLNASDIHLEPQKENVRLRYRIDGVLQEIATIPFSVYPYVLSRVKMLSDLKLNIKDSAQDGRFEIKLEKTEIDVRVSTLPGNFGENIVMRLLNQDMSQIELGDLGLRGRPFEQLMAEIQKPNGMILNTGPTGSGKTTTLYACLKKVNSPTTKIITIEDPIEYRLPNVNQTQVHKERGYDFATGLRSIVRQDPDVILVGEIRDEETSDIATHAALTGHIVFSTVHTNSATGAIPRLIDLGVRPSLIAPAVNAIIGQRLVRVLCPHCKEEYVPASETLETISKFLSIISPKANIEVPRNIKTLYRAVGCAKCHNLGYKGRIGIFEIFELNTELEKLVLEMAPESELTTVAMENGMITMLQDGILKAVAGETSMEEVQRVTGSGDYLEEIYDRIMTQLLSLSLVIRSPQIKKLIEIGYGPKELENLIRQSPSKEMLEFVIGGGLSFDAGDIHLEPEGETVRIRYRIDGILQNVASLQPSAYLPLLARLKALSGFKTDSHEAVRDSRFGIKLETALPNLDSNQVDVRVSIITSGYGETVVLRLLHKSAKSLDLQKIGFRPEIMEKLLLEIEKPNGLILNTGPTGSGKTTTLYSLLNILNKPEVKIITVEDPIEYRMKGILQTQVNTDGGYDFPSALRSLLRQNPDILMIGEIRDEETAKIAIQASLTGHLVLSTLHTNNAVASIQRLINMNIDPSDIASATNAMMAQRLVRRLCPHCKKEIKPDKITKEKIDRALGLLSKNSGIIPPTNVDIIYQAVGCNQCKGTGYSGVIPVAEVMTMSTNLEELVSRFSITSTITKAAMEEGMITMEQDGILRVAEGVTSFEEVARVTAE